MIKRLSLYFKIYSLKDGIINPEVKATEITNWLKEEFELGHGHAIATYATFK